MMYKGYQYTKGPFTDSPQYKIDEIIVKKEDLGGILKVFKTLNKR